MKIDFPDHPIGPWERIPFLMFWRWAIGYENRRRNWRWTVDHLGCRVRCYWEYRS